ncbi:MAG: radical SAM protein [Candidatus Verstraetearchaeota archaeon]|nr:radical SAM protein [Candidatus Verstraetearchaeota archaeon]
MIPKKWLDSRFIAYFNKAPPSIVCPSFWLLKWSTGCPFHCSYCYLQGTLYGKKQPRLKDLEEMRRELERFLSWADDSNLEVLLNAGELSDSLAIAPWTNKLIEILCEVLIRHNGHKVLLVTKGGTKHITPLLTASQNLADKFIVSFSVNSIAAAKKFENGAPSPDNRLKAAKILQEQGFEIRLRIDPVIPIANWKTSYLALLEKIFTRYELKPSRITIGTLRGLRKTIRFAKKRDWYQYLKSGEKTGWGLKPPFNLRIKMYSLLIESIRSYGYKEPIALCKETLEAWQALRKHLEDPGNPPQWQNVKCNCTL